MKPQNKQSFKLDKDKLKPHLKKKSLNNVDKEVASESDRKKIDLIEEIIVLDKDKLKYCKHPGCQQQHIGPHQHALKECKRHAFCEFA